MISLHPHQHILYILILTNVVDIKWPLVWINVGHRIMCFFIEIFIGAVSPPVISVIRLIHSGYLSLIMYNLNFFFLGWFLLSWWCSSKHKSFQVSQIDAILNAHLIYSLKTSYVHTIYFNLQAPLPPSYSPNLSSSWFHVLLLQSLQLLLLTITHYWVQLGLPYATYQCLY